MSDDENLSLYLYALGGAGVIVASIWLLSPAQIDAQRIALNAVDVGAIETATVAPRPAGEGLSWNGEQIPWRGYEDGMRQMADTGKRGVLILQADWCLVCRSYQKQFFDQKVVSHADDHVFMIADIEDAPELQRRFNIDGDYIPRTFLLEPDGSLARGATGGHPRQKFFVDPFRPDELRALFDGAPE